MSHLTAFSAREIEKCHSEVVEVADSEEEAAGVVFGAEEVVDEDAAAVTEAAEGNYHI